MIWFCFGVPTKIEIFHGEIPRAFRTITASNLTHPQLMSVLQEVGIAETGVLSEMLEVDNEASSQLAIPRPLSNQTTPITLRDVEQLCQEMWAGLHGHESRTDLRIRFGIEFIWKSLQLLDSLEDHIDHHPTVVKDPDRPAHSALVA